MTVLRTKTFVSTKAELLDERVNEFIETLNPINNIQIQPFLSTTSVGNPSRGLSAAYFVGCQILYYDDVEVQYQMDIFEGGEFQ